MTRSVAACLLVLVTLLAFAVRTLGLDAVFPGDGTVVFALGDAFYHARRALYSFEHFPAAILRDSLLNYPQGAFVPWPPLWDVALGGVARLFGRSQSVFEHVAAWAPAVLGALTVLPVYAAGRRLSGRAGGLGAAVLFALLPATVQYSNVGNVDHHAAQALIGALLLTLSLSLVSQAPEDRERVGRRFAALTATRTAMLLTWPGSLVYLGVGDGCLLAAGVLGGRRDLLAGEAASALASALLVLPVILVSGKPVGGPFSSIELSRLHVVALAAVAAVALGVRALDAYRPAPSAAARLLRAAAVGVPIVALLLAGTGAIHELALGFDYVAKIDAYAGMNLEQYPLFRVAPAFSDAMARQTLGFFAYLVPLAPLAVLARARTRALREPALLLAAWSAVFGALALLQVRFANDYAPAGSVSFALLVGSVARGATGRGRPRLAGALATVACVALLAPALVLHGRALSATLHALGDGADPVRRALGSYQGTMVRFAEAVRAATPDTAGFDDPSAAPEYGILAYPGIGHVLHYVARRATPADNFGPYIGPENYAAVNRFFLLGSEDDALAEAARLRARYVVTVDYGGSTVGALVNRLQRDDGTATSGRPAFAHFRLVTEGPAGGRTIAEQFGRGVQSQGPPYKLFEIVPGALLEVHARPGTPVWATVLVRTPARRLFTWRSSAVAGDDGIARLRVPYATETQAPARPVGPYRVTAGGAAYQVAVPEDAVTHGAPIAVGGEPR